jgi:hypothetical protein
MRRTATPDSSSHSLSHQQDICVTRISRSSSLHWCTSSLRTHTTLTPSWLKHPHTPPSTWLHITGTRAVLDFILYWLSSYGSCTVLGWSACTQPPSCHTVMGRLAQHRPHPLTQQGDTAHAPFSGRGEGACSDNFVILVGPIAQHAVG